MKKYVTFIGFMVLAAFVIAMYRAESKAFQSQNFPGGQVIQSGSITAGHDVMWTGSNTIQDAGFAPMQVSGAFTNGDVIKFNSLGQLVDAGFAPAPAATPLPTCQVSALGGGLLGLLATTSGTCNAAGAIVGKTCQSNATNGSLPGGWKVDCAVTSSGVITVQLTGLVTVGVTPPSLTYNATVIQ